jgi:hypothetical protein
MGSDTPHGEISMDASLAQTHHRALKNLNPFPVTLNDPIMYAHCIPWSESRDVGIGLDSFN